MPRENPSFGRAVVHSGWSRNNEASQLASHTAHHSCPGTTNIIFCLASAPLERKRSPEQDRRSFFALNNHISQHAEIRNAGSPLQTIFQSRIIRVRIFQASPRRRPQRPRYPSSTCFQILLSTAFNRCAPCLPERDNRHINTLWSTTR